MITKMADGDVTYKVAWANFIRYGRNIYLYVKHVKRTIMSPIQDILHAINIQS